MARRAKIDTRLQIEAKRRGITRLCHLTPLRNLLHIASGHGLRSVAELATDRSAFDQQDLDRLDNHPDHISCSIEYPNVWYLRGRIGSATPTQRMFPDWVCLSIDPKYLWSPNTKFSPRNAAALGGSLLHPGYEAFEALYAESIPGTGGVSRGRDLKPASCPTDDQAEVMIQKHIPLADANIVIVRDEEQAKRILSALRLAKAPIDELQFHIAPTFFETRLSSILRRGQLPTETRWTPDQAHGYS